jgi:uncharacterized protein YbjT (DUF2867 family)
MTPQRVLLAGATGLVGGECLAQLRGDARVAQVVSLQRRAGAASDDARVRIVETDFGELDRLPAEVFAAGAALCALGTTIRIAGSQPAFRRVDHDYVLAFARRARAAGVARFGLVSAIGADPDSRVFYNRVKGDTEADVAALGFDTCVFVRPSLLLGEREEFRLGERLAMPFGRWLPKAWRAVPAARVAQRLIAATLEGASGVHVIENAELL